METGLILFFNFNNNPISPFPLPSSHRSDCRLQNLSTWIDGLASSQLD
jgi:hypothetical protein